MWNRLPEAQQAGDWTPERLRANEDATLEKLAQLCEPEIREAVSEDLGGAELCGVYILTVGDQEAVGGMDLTVIHAGVRRAASTVTASGKPPHEHVKVCVAAAIRAETSRRAAYLNGLKIPDLLSALSSTTLLRAGLLIDYLEDEQRNALSSLLYRELGNKPRPARMDKQPKMPTEPTLKQRYAWLHWYLWRTFMHRPEVKRKLGGVPRIVVIADGDRMLINKKTGKCADPLGPIHARVWPVLGRELNKRGHPIKDPESKNRVAKSIGVSRSTLKRYEDAAIPVKITPDGKGGVWHEFTMNDLVSSLEVSARKRPVKRKKDDT